MDMLKHKILKKPAAWLAIFVGFILAIAIVEAALPTISLDAPVSFPVDI